MGYVLIIAAVFAVGAVVFALTRGLIAFANMKPNEVDENGIPKSLHTQNKMMFSRVKWQAIAIAIMVLLMIIASAG